MRHQQLDALQIPLLDCSVEDAVFKRAAMVECRGQAVQLTCMMGLYASGCVQTCPELEAQNVTGKNRPNQIPPHDVAMVVTVR
jgi:hypothetical protein